MKRKYLIYSFVALLAWMILEKIDNELKWIALGFGVMMMLFGIFMKDKVEPILPNEDSEEIIDDLNKKEGNKNGI